MAEQKRNGGSHSKPDAGKKNILFGAKKKKDEPVPDNDALLDVLPADGVPAAGVSDAPYEPPFHPDEAAPEDRDAAPLQDEEEKRGEPGRGEARRARREAEKAARREAAAVDTPEKAERRRKRNIALIVAGFVAAIIIAGASYGGYAVTESALTLPKVYVGGIFVGSMTEDETRAALKAGGWDETAAGELTVKLPAGIDIVLKRADAGTVLSTDEAVAASLRYGHDGSWYQNLFRYISNFFSSADLVEYYRAVDESYVRAGIDKGLEEFKTATAESGYVIEEEKSMMYMIKGGGQMELDEDALCQQALAALISGKSELEYSTFVSQPSMPDFEAIHKELEREPVDASFTDTFEVVDDVVGCKFDIAQAQSIWTAAEFGQSIEIPLEISYPAVTSEALEAMLYRDVLGEQTTYYPNSSDNRINNLNMAVKKISGLVLLPGETFSYNETVGQRTEAAGFLPAGAYDDGEVVEQIGGGVCQVSSTLYSATLYAQMQTVDRTCHFFAVDYLDKGMDATVSWPKPDFKFKNCRDYPIMIIAYCDNEARSLTVQIKGTDVDGTYVQIRRDTYTKYGEYGEAIGYSVFQYRDIYSADGTYLRTETYDYLDDYYFHDYKTITEKAKAAAEGAASTDGSGDSSGGEYSGTF